MIGLDTNVLLRWLIDESIWPDDNPGQTAAVGALLINDAESFYVNSIVLAETLWVLQNPMKQPKPVLVEVLSRLLHSANVVLQDRGAVIAAKDSFAKQASGIHDRLIAEINSIAGCDHTFTFDVQASKTSGFRLLKAKG